MPHNIRIVERDKHKYLNLKFKMRRFYYFEFGHSNLFEI